MKAKKQKLNFKPTPISRLLRYKTPIKMVGDPVWQHRGDSDKTMWREREKAVYAEIMQRKSWDKPWSPEMWDVAHTYNLHIISLEYRKWDDHTYAIGDNWDWDYHEAQRDNAAWDYHHEYAVDLEAA